MNDFNKQNQTSNTQQPTDQWQSVSYESSNVKFDNLEENRDGNSNFYHRNSPEISKPPQNGGLKLFLLLLAVLICIVILVVAGYFGYLNRNKQQQELDMSSESQIESASSSESEPLLIQEIPETSTQQLEALSQGEMSTEDIATKTMPSVVGIEVLQLDGNYEIISGGGSGIIATQDGYIITNAHVVLNKDTLMPATKIDVHLDNGEVYSATMVGADNKTDLAVIKVNAENLTPAEFGDSTQLKVGEKAIAIGNPGGMVLASSLTQGVISGVNRVISNSSSESTTYIQTDAAINPGNSGGALVNKYGQVVGINTIKIVREDYEGIGFAIPINEAKPIIDSLIQNGYVAGRVRIGITFTEISDSKAELLKVPAGLRVISVDSNSDAYAKGVQKGDIITHINDQTIKQSNDIKGLLTGKTPGDVVSLTIYRVENGQPNTLQIEVALQEDTSGKLSE